LPNLDKPHHRSQLEFLASTLQHSHLQSLPRRRNPGGSRLALLQSGSGAAAGRTGQHARDPPTGPSRAPTFSATCWASRSCAAPTVRFVVNALLVPYLLSPSGWWRGRFLRRSRNVDRPWSPVGSPPRAAGCCPISRRFGHAETDRDNMLRHSRKPRTNGPPPLLCAWSRQPTRQEVPGRASTSK